MTKNATFLGKLLLLTVFVAGCASDGGTVASSGSGGPAKVVKREGRPDVVEVGEKDLAMEKAIETARKTVKVFIAALKAPKPGQSSFCIKKRFVAGVDGEHIWLTDPSFDGKLFHGTVGNDPVEVKEVKMGDKVTVAPSEISDWMYVDKGKLVGGTTILVLYDQSSPEEKREYEREIGFKLR